MSTLIKDSNGDWKQAAGNYSVWSGTRAELEAALAGGTIPNGTVAVVTDDYAMQGVSCVPDWDHAVYISPETITAGYTCPDNGYIVSGGSAGNTTNLIVNGIILPGPIHTSYGNSQSFPVNKGDIVSNTSFGWALYFVPWKK